MIRRLVCTALLLIASLAHGQDTSRTVVISPRVWVDQRVMDKLSADWSEDPYQVERGYCVRVARMIDWETGMTEYQLNDIWPAAVQGATYTSIKTIECPDFSDVTILHVHPPTTRPGQWFGDLNDTTRVFGGRNAYECWPSSIDMNSLIHSTRDFDLVQCDKHAIVPYFRAAYKEFKPLIVHVPVFVYDTVKIPPKKTFFLKRWLKALW